MIKYNDFVKVEIRTGTIVQVKKHEKAIKPAFKLEIDFGSSIGVLKSSAQITDFYDPENLIGKKVIAVVNLPDKQIADFKSECLVLGVPTENGVSLLSPDHSVPNGLRIS